MDYEHPFVQEVRANPHDVAPRLIYADYLEEAGDQRAELIRVQVQLSQLPAGDPARRDLELRESELLDEHADEWLAPLREMGIAGLSARSFQRGLIERVRIDARSLLRHGVALCQAAPALHHIELRTEKAERLELGLVQADLPAQIISLDLGYNMLPVSVVEQLASAQWCRQLQNLSLTFNRLGDDAMDKLGLGDWRALTRLTLSVNNIGPAGISALVKRPTMPKLTALALNSNPLSSLGVEVLAASYLSQTLRELDLGACGLTTLQRLLDMPLGEQLESLVVRGNRLSDMSETIRLLEKASKLKFVDLRGTHRTETRYGYGSAATDVPAALRERLGDGLLW